MHAWMDSNHQHSDLESDALPIGATDAYTHFCYDKHILFIGQILVYLLIKFKTFYCSNLRFCTLKEIQTPIPPLEVVCPVQLNYVGNLGEWWVSIPLPPESQSGTLPIELQTPYKKPHSVSGEVNFRYRHWKNKSLTITYTLCVSYYSSLVDSICSNAI